MTEILLTGSCDRTRSPVPPVAVVGGFLDAINRGDIDRLCLLMTDEHRLVDEGTLSL